MGEGGSEVYENEMCGVNARMLERGKEIRKKRKRGRDGNGTQVLFTYFAI